MFICNLEIHTSNITEIRYFLNCSFHVSQRHHILAYMFEFSFQCFFMAMRHKYTRWVRQISFINGCKKLTLSYISASFWDESFLFASTNRLQPAIKQLIYRIEVVNKLSGKTVFHSYLFLPFFFSPIHICPEINNGESEKVSQFQRKWQGSPRVLENAVP